ncbi:hypothetical protein O6H91_08G096000 [Diphasiastrum complanatum]|uniref:Uncharacterized protein n=1 Tax=Diphasiastrum complanatum TaxID=34168 RepID=A0ACC2D068_DIPCM|nr:hypothetical protein O6H91_08G096000 [Diphasiastrum complanatum]
MIFAVAFRHWWVANKSMKRIHEENNGFGRSHVLPDHFKVLFQLISAGLVTIILLYSSFLRTGPSYPLIPRDYFAQHFKSQSVHGNISASVQNVIEALRNATPRAAENSSQIVIDPAWSEKNPCRSRAELTGFYSERRYAKNLGENLEWEAVMSEYEKLHHACIQKIGNATSYFLSKNNSSACKFVIAHSNLGLGNKILTTVSTFMYAIMTQRVMLISSKTFIPDIMCEPFYQSSWRLPEDFPMPDQSPDLWSSEDSIFSHIERTTKDKVVSSTGLYAVKSGETYAAPSSRLFCSTELNQADDIPWVLLAGCMYFLPRLFSVPHFRPALEALFPDYMVLTHVLRSIMLPADPIWARVLSARKAYLQGADRMVGIQVRYREGYDHYTSTRSEIEARIQQCTIENGLLPIPDRRGWAWSSSRLPMATCAPTIKVFVASLFPSFHDRLHETYIQYPTIGGENVAVIQLSFNQYQSVHLEEDKKALMEMLLLSYADDLIVTPTSTFGGVAQAYGALIPWFINFNTENRTEAPNCLRGQTVDVCYQKGPEIYHCPHDPDTNGKSITSEVPYIQRCLTIDGYKDIKGGIQLITSN